MNVGKTLSAQVLEFVPWKTSHRIKERQRGDSGAFYVIDRGYVDSARLDKVHQAGAFFVMRAKRNRNARRIYSAATDRTTGIIWNQLISMNGHYIGRDYPEHLRRVRFKDPESGKNLIFLTNNTTLPALTVATLYKNRRHVELFSKWIKQHLRIKKFLSTSQNAVKKPIWCAVSAYVRIAIVKKELHLDASLYTLLQILSVSVFEKTQISCALQPNADTSKISPDASRLNFSLFNRKFIKLDVEKLERICTYSLVQ